MQLSLRQSNKKPKITNMKRSIDAYFTYQTCNLNNSFKIQKKQNLKTEASTNNQSQFTKQAYPDNLSSFASKLLSSKKATYFKQFSHEKPYQAFSLTHKRKYRYKIGTLSYRNQRQNSNLKTQVAKKYLDHIDQLKINSVNNVNNIARFNKDIQFSGQILVFSPYKTIQELKQQKYRFALKQKQQIQMRAETSYIKIKNSRSSSQKTSKNNFFRTKKFSNLQILQASLSLLPLIKKKSSICGWETQQQHC